MEEKDEYGNNLCKYCRKTTGDRRRKTCERCESELKILAREDTEFYTYAMMGSMSFQMSVNELLRLHKDLEKIENEYGIQFDFEVASHITTSEGWHLTKEVLKHIDHIKRGNKSYKK